jgi:hypothetical protein
VEQQQVDLAAGNEPSVVYRLEQIIGVGGL